MSVIGIALIIFGSLALLSLILYLPKLIQFFYSFQKPKHLIASEKRRISLVVPARNESGVIGDLLSSIRLQTYDKAFYDVNVIVQDENDPTVQIAKEFGANVFVVPEQNCKGAALDGYFHRIADRLKEYAAFAIIDADAYLPPNYVEELNNALEHNYDIYLSRKNIKNYLGDKSARSLVCNSVALTYPVLDETGNTFRTRKGIPLNMCGQGMMVRAGVIETLKGWPYRTLTEDYEMKLDSVLKDFTSMFYPYAVIYTEEVVRHRDSWQRRLRWLVGYSQGDKLYKKQIRKKFKEEGASLLMRFEFFYSLVPLICFIVTDILTALFGIGLTVYYACTGSILWWKALLLLTAMPLSAMYVLDLLYSVLCYLSYRDAMTVLTFREKLAMLLFAPIFMFEYFPLYVQGKYYVKKQKPLAWKHTRRIRYTKEVSLEKDAPLHTRRGRLRKKRGKQREEA